MYDKAFLAKKYPDYYRVPPPGSEPISSYSGFELTSAFEKTELCKIIAGKGQSDIVVITSISIDAYYVYADALGNNVDFIPIHPHGMTGKLIFRIKSGGRHLIDSHTHYDNVASLDVVQNVFFDGLDELIDYGVEKGDTPLVVNGGQIFSIEVTKNNLNSGVRSLNNKIFLKAITKGYRLCLA